MVQIGSRQLLLAVPGKSGHDDQQAALLQGSPPNECLASRGRFLPDKARAAHPCAVVVEGQGANRERRQHRRDQEEDGGALLGPVKGVVQLPVGAPVDEHHQDAEDDAAQVQRQPLQPLRHQPPAQDEPLPGCRDPLRQCEAHVSVELSSGCLAWWQPGRFRRPSEQQGPTLLSSTVS